VGTGGPPVPAGIGAVETTTELAAILRELRRREARRRGAGELTVRELAGKTGWSHGIISQYFAGKVLPPTDRFDALVRLLGANPAEQGELATARDRVEDRRRAAHTQTSAAVAGQPRIPRELPTDVYAFTGRTAQLVELDRLLADADRASGVPIAVVSGTAGAGKSALAVRWAHRVADRFPDGQLYVNLRGYDSGEPVPPAEVLSWFLRSLGVDGASVPTDPDERAARYRTLLAGRRLLILLDNARTAEQIRPLLPGSATCLVLVTSRDDLAGLVARDGARRVELDVMNPDEALALLTTLIGDRVITERSAAADLARQCAYLPLALRLAAELAAGQPETPLADLAEELSDEGHRLDLLDAGGDRNAAVRAVFSWSLRHLSDAAARAFTLIGLHPGRELDAYALAALIGTDLTEARRLIGELTRANVLQPGAAARCARHDLMHAYAAERAASLDRGVAQAALTRLLDHYRGVAMSAVDSLYPYEQSWRPRVPPAPEPVPNVGTPDAAQRWLDAERTNLVILCRWAADGWHQHAVDLSLTLWRYLDDQGHYQDAVSVHQAIIHSGQSEPRVLDNLGVALLRVGRTAEALATLRDSAARYRADGDRHGAARVLTSLGTFHYGLGEFRYAVDFYEQAAIVYRATGDQLREAWALGQLGLAYARLGRYTEAAEHARRSLALCQEVGEPSSETYAVGTLALVLGRLGHHSSALDLLHRCLSTCRQVNHRRGQAETLSELGRTYRHLGRYDVSLDCLDQALHLAGEAGDRSLTMMALNYQGETLRWAGQPAAAQDRHWAVLKPARQLGHRYQLANALAGLAGALQDTGQPVRASRFRSCALDLYVDLGVPEAEDLRRGP
jgi:tetratricopeptide (TPR) repeat protein/transcriptional regulator with XRE-family HTH domain